MGHRAPACHSRQHMVVSEGDYALQLGEAKGVWVVAMFAGVIAPFTVMAILVGWAIPDHVSRLELLTKMTVMGEWGWFRGAAGLCSG